MTELLPSHRLLVRVVAAAALCIPLGGTSARAAAAEPAGAEYAIRWNARDGGLTSLNETMAILQTRATRPRQFKVDYYDIPPDSAAPPGFATILRRRVEDGGQAELTWKLRGDHALADWTCPWRKFRGTKAQVDVTFGGADTLTRNYSYSCTSDSPELAASELSATIKACTAVVSRRDAGSLRVEEWRIPGDVVIIEVSGSGENSPGAMEQFRKRVALPLLAAGIVPLQDSKTELGSRCP